MQTFRPTKAFQHWVDFHCQPNERASIASLLRDLNAYGLPRKDPALITLKQGAHIGSRVGLLEINVFILPERISTARFRAKRMWFGLAEMVPGATVVLDRICMLKGWDADPSLGLVAAEAELIKLMEDEFS